MPSNGGCEVLADPRHSAKHQPIFWSVHANPAAIVLTPGSTPSTLRLTSDDLRPLMILQHAPSLMRLDIRGDQYDVELTDPDDRRTLCALTILDALTPDRLASLERFWSGLAGKRVPADQRVTRQRRARARLMLRAIDGDAAQATYRAIALQLYPQHPTEPGDWVGSPVRETVIRLARDGRVLVRGGYLDLMRRPRRSRG